MNCEIGQNIVGCRVVIETQNGTIEGDVRHVDPSRSKMSIVNGILVPSGIQLPSLYRVFVRDILSSKICLVIYNMDVYLIFS